MALEFEIDGKQFRSGALDAFTQDAIVRRLLPVAGAVFGAYQRFASGDKAAALADGTSALSKLSDADAQFIIRTCLGATYRKQLPQDVWVSVLPNGGKMAFDDITLLDIYEIVFNVLRDNLAPFFSGIARRGLTVPA